MYIDTCQFMRPLFYVQGIDATAARSAFLQLQNTTALHGITICYAGMMTRLLFPILSLFCVYVFSLTMTSDNRCLH